MENIKELLQQLGITDGAHMDRMIRLYANLSHSDQAALEFIFGRAGSRIKSDADKIIDLNSHNPFCNC